MLFDLKSPLLGFESISQMELEKIDDIFMRLKSPDKEQPSFTLVNPFVLREYAFDVPAALQSAMGITDISNLLVYNIIVIQKPIENSVVNFLAPLVFNTDNHTMAQLILEGDYGIAEPIADFLDKAQNDA